MMCISWFRETIKKKGILMIQHFTFKNVFDCRDHLQGEYSITYTLCFLIIPRLLMILLEAMMLIQLLLHLVYLPTSVLPCYGTWPESVCKQNLALVLLNLSVTSLGPDKSLLVLISTQNSITILFIKKILVKANY
jgi:hypothetical protein